MMQHEERPTATLYEVRDERGIVIGQDYHLAAVTCATVFTEAGGSLRVGRWFTTEQAARDSIALCRHQPCRVMPAKPAEPPPVPKVAGKRGNPYLKPAELQEAMRQIEAGTPPHIVADRFGVRRNTLYHAIYRAKRRNDNERERKTT